MGHKLLHHEGISHGQTCDCNDAGGPDVDDSSPGDDEENGGHLLASRGNHLRKGEVVVVGVRKDD